MIYRSFKYSKFLLTVLVSVISINELRAQTVGISDVTFTPNTQAVLDLSSDRRGFLPPRMELNGDDLPISGTKPAGLMVYNSGGAIGPNGLYYWTGSAWTQITTTSSSIGGSGTLNYVPKFTPNGTTIGNSSIFDDGNVGINTTTASTKLDVRAGSSSSILTDYTQALSDKHGLLLTGSYGSGNYTPGVFWNTDNENPTKPKAGIFLNTTAAGSKMLFGTSTTYATGLTNTAMAIDDLGNVGIGTVNPGAELHINQDDNAMGLYITGGGVGVDIARFQRDVGSTGIVGIHAASGDPQLYFNDEGANGVWTMGVQSSSNNLRFAASSAVGTNDRMTIQQDGNVGLGTTVPTQVLDVNGKVRMRTGGTAGYIPVSDANGVMTWTDPTTISTSDDGDWTISGSNQYSAVAGNVGIGQTSPGSKLHVGGNVSVSGSVPSNVWGEVIGFGVSGTGGGTQGIIGHQGGHELNLYWNFHRIAGGSTFTGLSANGYTSANAISLGNSGILFNATTTMGSSRPAEVMRITNDGNVGINTTSPNEKLDVEGNVYAQRLRVKSNSVATTSDLSFTDNAHIETDDAMTFSVDSDNNGTSSYFGFGTNSAARDGNYSELVRIQENGFVGIGTTSPNARLVINPGTSGNTTIGGRTINLGSHLYSVSGRSGYSVEVSNAFTGDSDNAGFLWMFPHSSGGNANHKPFRAAVGATLSDIFYVKQDGGSYFAGNMGIGTTSPSEKLDVDGNVYAQRLIVKSNSVSTTSDISLTANAHIETDNAMTFSIDSDNNETGSYFAFGTNSAARDGNFSELVRITESGSVGIGSSSPGGRLDMNYSGTGGSGTLGIGDHLNITSFTPNITLNDQSSSVDNFAFHLNQSILTIGAYTSSSAMSNDLVIWNGNVGMGVINNAYKLWVNGTAAKPGGGSWINSSDKRLKQDIKPYSDGLDKVMAIRPVTYHYNKLSGYDTEKEYVGVIAQELKEVAPYMVGSYQKDGAEYLAVDNSAMMYMLINAVQEQQKAIEAERAEKEAMQQQINELMKRMEKLEKR